jgi:RNA polymerase sigma-70 factor, ECF subfamily
MISTAPLASSSFAERASLTEVTSGPNRGYHPADTTDADLVRATIAGDAAAFAELVERHSRSCLRYATRMLGNREDAEDATQEALLRAYRALPRYDTRMPFRTWLMSILINRCRTALLSRRRRAARIVYDDDAVEHARVDGVEPAAVLRMTIEDAVNSLDPNQREAFLLKHVEQLSYEEMSAATGVGISALKMRVQRACDRLQQLMPERDHA